MTISNRLSITGSRRRCIRYRFNRIRRWIPIRYRGILTMVIGCIRFRENMSGRIRRDGIVNSCIRCRGKSGTMIGRDSSGCWKKCRGKISSGGCCNRCSVIRSRSIGRDTSGSIGRKIVCVVTVNRCTVAWRLTANGTGTGPATTDLIFSLSLLTLP